MLIQSHRTLNYQFTNKIHTRGQKPIKRPVEKPPLRIISSMLLSLVIIGLTFFIVSHVESNEQVQLVKVTVASGDTLWSIAKANYSGSGDLREFIYYIKRVNQLTSAQIFPGQVLFIPLVE